MAKKISVSFLNCKKVTNVLRAIDLTDADFIHVDHVDGRLTKGKFKPLRTLEKIGSTLNKRLDVHLMVKKPLKLIRKYAELNTEYITIHIELEKDIDKYLNEIKSYGIKCGLAINPDTDISRLDPYLDKIDLILVMSIIPGKTGQPFIDDSIDRVIDIKNKLKEHKSKCLIAIDGGINNENIKKLNDVDIVISTSYILKSDDWQKAINDLR